ncbi:RNA polymerase sigma factor [Paenibacillus sp. CN-4]|uniref:RNA polymerase sigma factor n=1 Tax=Paenibacillus nanchangensis TaxID=3348343 RepID=UPI0039792A99
MLMIYRQSHKGADAARDTEENRQTHTARGQDKIGELARLHQAELLRYCRHLTGSAWEAEDLAQDTWIKLAGALARKWEQPEISRSYLFKAAYHVWIDRSRRKQLTVTPLPDEGLPGPAADPLELRAAMESLIERLPPGQRTAVLLIDALMYTPAEAAELLGTTPGAVKALLHRARRKLAETAEAEKRGDSARESGRSGRKPESNDNRVRSERRVDEKVVSAYIKAFAERDAKALSLLMNDASPLDLVPVVTGCLPASQGRTDKRNPSRMLMTAA